MPLIRISADAERAIRTSPFSSSAFAGVSPNADGTFDIPLQWTTIERLRSVQLEDESLSDTILRICTTAKAGLQ